MDLLQALIRRELHEYTSSLSEAREFMEWLSPDVMRLLISNYANSSAALGSLKWVYAELPSNTWGSFSSKKQTLYVNQAKTKNRFKQQVTTILHEIQHWNQFIELAAEQNADDSYDAVRYWREAYDAENSRRGYWNNKFEVDARRFSNVELKGAMQKIGDHYGGRVEGEMADVIEELFDIYMDDEKPLSRKDIGETLRDYGYIGPKFMAQALEQLRALDVKIR